MGFLGNRRMGMRTVFVNRAITLTAGTRQVSGASISNRYDETGNNEVYIYMNAVPMVGPVTVSGSALSNNNLIFNNGGSNGINCPQAQTCLWNRALSQPEIAQLWQNPYQMFYSVRKTLKKVYTQSGYFLMWS
jgi:hypothetical protein